MHEYIRIKDKEKRYSLSDTAYILYRKYMRFNVLANFVLLSIFMKPYIF